jgi:hypothetical protein
MWPVLKARLSKLHKSWTVWFNALMGAATYALPAAAEQFPSLSGYIPDKWYHYMAGAIMFGNFLLRIKTSKPLEAK